MNWPHIDLLPDFILAREQLEMYRGKTNKWDLIIFYELQCLYLLVPIMKMVKVIGFIKVSVRVRVRFALLNTNILKMLSIHLPYQDSLSGSNSSST